MTLAGAARADEPLRVFAAGSLRAAFTELGAAFQARQGTPVQFRFAPSGLLRDGLLAGEKADLFASANMAHPEALATKGVAGPVRRFARNTLCALASPKVSVTGQTLLARMLDPAVKLGTSTPKADPSGDYAFALFGKAEALQAGAEARLAGKALKLTGGADSPPPPKDRSQYGKLVEDGAADIFLTYCTNAYQARQEAQALQVLSMPRELEVGADYGLTVLAGAPPAAGRFADFVLSADGQAILAKYGFASGGH